ncbi:MAG: UDP-N-acetylglucosamine 2-epimerase (non-hydrolyzing) [Ectothiorhodospiraceae bacterium]|nr:UDP-N-acetylglucosamine 2-epimerase (non-hydrolyzing) [Ectothiorhodospiraceae bacterium]
MVKLLSVVGARPNFMKVGPLHRAFQKYTGSIEHVILHTGQHYDERMSKIFFEDLELPQPDIYLGVGSGSHAEQTAKIMTAFEAALQEQRPDCVIVVGDVNSTLACSVTSSKLGIPVVHVEAGLRSNDRGMPEEINRLVTDVLSDHLFVSEPSGLENLRREGVPDEKVHFVGNVMIDSLIHFKAKAESSTIRTDIGVGDSPYVLITLHRPSNVDSRENLGKILDIFKGLPQEYKLVFPVHPRTKDRLKTFGLWDDFANLPNIILGEPTGYLDFLHLMMNSALLLTDSGGIQEETTYLQIPCLTLRENTERPVTITEGTNRLLSLNPAEVIRAAEDALSGNTKKGRIPELWDGHAAERIAAIMNTLFTTGGTK